jgi:hypothetical protein
MASTSTTSFGALKFSSSTWKWISLFQLVNVGRFELPPEGNPLRDRLVPIHVSEQPHACHDKPAPPVRGGGVFVGRADHQRVNVSPGLKLLRPHRPIPIRPEARAMWAAAYDCLVSYLRRIALTIPQPGFPGPTLLWSPSVPLADYAAYNGFSCARRSHRPMRFE